MPADALYCISCGYALPAQAGLCPECGRAFDPARPLSTAKSSFGARTRRFLEPAISPFDIVLWVCAASITFYACVPPGYFSGPAVAAAVLWSVAAVLWGLRVAEAGGGGCHGRRKWWAVRSLCFPLCAAAVIVLTNESVPERLGFAVAKKAFEESVQTSNQTLNNAEFSTPLFRAERSLPHPDGTIIFRVLDGAGNDKSAIVYRPSDDITPMVNRWFYGECMRLRPKWFLCRWSSAPHH